MNLSGAGHMENIEPSRLVGGCTCWGRREIWASTKISAMDKLWTLSEEMPCEALTVALGWLPCTRRAGTAVTPPTALIRAIHINLPAQGYCQVCREMLQEKDYGAIGEDTYFVPGSNSAVFWRKVILVSKVILRYEGLKVFFLWTQKKAPRKACRWPQLKS